MRYGFDQSESDPESATCSACGGTFWRQTTESWKHRCFDCWRKSKTGSRGPGYRGPFGSGPGYSAPPPPPPRAEPIVDELAANLRALLQLAHPDKHGGSVTATRVTAWLLDVRRRLGS